ncbi:YeeE/YedE thiosulfate transporter family protein [Pseudomonas sp. NBRC 111142]|uniref:YeeE/YedE thiosulfate transporter family protein n=1 Tax=Pseudomonas sp. NBRC 111142 TaxID=1661057 RepID=UPI0006D43B75|nr:YeeE/YedE thiosulfate transporter family protein [Pseudomonas sp. NBRC 111142]
MLIPALSAFLAFVTGYAIKRGNICAVAAVHQWVQHKDSYHLRAFLTAMCCSGIALISITWSMPGVTSLSPAYMTTLATLSGAVLFGIGAWVNQACVLGTVAFLCRGDINYGCTLIGMFLGSIMGQYGSQPVLQSPVSPLESPSGFALAAGLYGFGLIFGLRHHVFRHPRRSAKYRHFSNNGELLPMMIIVGGCCGALHALNGEWTYLAALVRLAARTITASAGSPISTICIYAFAVFAGGLFSAWHSGEFRAPSLSMRLASRKLAGGTAMGFAACKIPGGNESMLFYGAPSLATHAIVAYVAMTLTVLCITYIHHVARQQA